MVTFPNAKINLGLDIVARRPDSYHDLRTLMVGVEWCDILEIVPNGSDRATLAVSGRPCACAPDDNLVMKAYRAMGSLPGVDIYLHKIIPDGAGLGGGSADAAFTIKALNDLFNIGHTSQELEQIAATVGADCPFFIANTPALATDTGTTLTPVEIPALGSLRIAIVKPRGISVSTKTAYSRVVPATPQSPTADRLDPARWVAEVKNGFEPSVFAAAPELAIVKQRMQGWRGCVYASMSGSGSAIYGLFPPAELPTETELQAAFPEADCFAGSFIIP